MTSPAGAALAAYGVVRVAGKDAPGFLQRLLTSSFENLDGGEARPTLLLDNKGRIQAAMLAVARDGELALVGEREPLEGVRDTLSRYVLGADVALETTQDAVLFLGSAVGDEPAGAAGVQSVTGPRGGAWALTDDADGAVEALAAAGHQVLDPPAFEGWRVANGWPRHGAEITGREFPQELRLEAAVDFDKGCYLGQETVARIHYRGQVNRLLCLLDCDGSPAVGDAVCAGSAEVGRLSSVADRDGGMLALGLLSRDQAEPGTLLATAGGVPLRVAAWPDASA